ncbi:MAG TPA: carbohydrate ABC transporter permease [Mycobacteriales bacterium]|jgi:cellobiose transport system permease protein|nr:carbohydrate ABC transporter permease [Mycobacteriales bacterium]
MTASMWMKRGFLHLVLLLGLVISIFPFYWLFVMASNTTGDIFKYPPKLTIGSQLLVNMRNMLNAIDFWGAFMNSLFVAVVTAVLVVFFDSLAAFVFAKFEFPGKKPLFVILLATFMVPAQLSVVPQFVVMAHLGWVGSFKALIIPAMVNAYGIFLARQYAEGAISADLLEAARIDGAGFFRLYWNVAVPVLRPIMSFLGIFTFIAMWNDYLWPLIVLTNPQKLTLQVALAQLNSLNATDYSMVMAGTLLAAVPLIIVFLFGARQFIRDLAAGAVKG